MRRVSKQLGVLHPVNQYDYIRESYQKKEKRRKKKEKKKEEGTKKKRKRSTAGFHLDSANQ